MLSIERFHTVERLTMQTKGMEKKKKNIKQPMNERLEIDVEAYYSLGTKKYKKKAEWAWVIDLYMIISNTI